MENLDSYLDKIQLQEIEPLTALIIVGATAGVVNAINLTYRTYKEYLTKAGRACSELTERERAICMLHYKIEGKEKQLSQLQKLVEKCKQNKHVQKCKIKLAQEIQKIKNEIKRMNERIKAIHKDYQKEKGFVRKVGS